MLVGVIKQGSKWAEAEGSIMYSQAELARYRVQSSACFPAAHLSYQCFANDSNNGLTSTARPITNSTLSAFEGY